MTRAQNYSLGLLLGSAIYAVATGGPTDFTAGWSGAALAIFILEFFHQ